MRRTRGRTKNLAKNSSNRVPHRSESCPSPSIPSVEACVVCLDSITDRGKIPVCDHHFCYTCIFEWSKNTNTCPLCKKRFRCITKISKNGPPRKVRVSDKNQSEHLEDISALIPIDEYIYSDNDSTSSSLNGFIVRDDDEDDDTYSPHQYDTDSSDDFIPDNNNNRSTNNNTNQPSFSTPLHTMPTTTPLHTYTSPSVSLLQLSSDDDYVIPSTKMHSKRRILSSPLNDIHSSPLSPFQPVIKRSLKRTILSSSSEDEKKEEEITQASGWLSSRKQIGNQGQHNVTTNRKKKPNCARYCVYSENIDFDDDSDWTPPNN